ncbi:zona pellucida sperm-binding protein 3 receptor-like isoform X1 [Meriones unguiculatus]|uniref:zona pellucida sperm-binding protein 3 receptor-like isoform X1 n=2 Tax=Meriones unguiculatus TaxID=10047 RepID=UPI00293F0E8E|nr:zona pellucida sperm-binding protein 3 receptor-like isoform X1 [Meriones unguiculatus]XP_060228007.1 zona pellucida sperm-binding protein 3 receptor-like isoform X1 [Meriones unguiculatus]
MCPPGASHTLTTSSTFHRKGTMTAWSFLELWKTSHSTLLQMTLVTVLMVPVLGDCGPPPGLPFAAPVSQMYETIFPTGSVLKYACRHGFRKINSSLLTCDENGSWAYNIFCVKKQCRNPGELINGKVEITTDLFLGSTIEFSCSKGYVLIGSATSRCEIQGKGVDWSDSLPECVIVTCESPPDISNGKHSGTEEDLFSYGSIVTYSCNPSFILAGNASIVCTVVNKTVGVWSSRPPTCENEHQLTENGTSASNLVRPMSFPGPLPKDGCTNLPDIPNASWDKNSFPLRKSEVYEIGTNLKYHCNYGYQPASNESHFVTCQENQTWSPSRGCERICCPTPNMEKIKIVSERRDFTGICTYAYGDYIFYICGEGSYPMSMDGRSSCQADGKWGPAIPSCQEDLKNLLAVTSPQLPEINITSSPFISANDVCPKPFIINGNLSVEKDYYAKLENVTVQCDIGFDLVGSPNIICSENKTWHPDIPHCKLEVLEDCRVVNEGRKLLQCLSSPDDVKRALQVYKLSLEIELLEQQKKKWTKVSKKSFKRVKVKGPLRPFG